VAAAAAKQVVPAGKAAPLVKVGLDQAIIGPLVCFSFFSLMGLMVWSCGKSGASAVFLWLVSPP